MKRMALSVAGMTLLFVWGSLAYKIDDAQAQMRNRPPPPSFAAIDANGDGYVTKDEFESFRQKRMEMMAAQGRPMRNAGRGIPFSTIDANGDGRISSKEFSDHIAAHMRRMWQGQGGN